jgi:Ca-activated chloride channel family protein
MPDAFAGVPLVLRGRYRGSTENAVARLDGITASGEKWEVTVPAVRAEGALAAVWARGHLRDLEDRYAAGAADSQALEHRIVAVSLRHHVLCRFTALVAVDSRVVAEGGPQHRVLQPVELPSGWDVQQFSGLQSAAARPPGDAAMPLSLSSAPLSSAPPSFAPRAGHALGARRARAGGAHLGIAAARGELNHDARMQLAAEAHLLRNAGTPTTPERLTILSDLASRIFAVIQYVGPQADPLRELATALATCEGPNPPRGADLDALWQRALDVLDKFAGNPPTRRAFWKRS